MTRKHCPICSGSRVRQTADAGHGRGVYGCNDCGAAWTSAEPFAVLTEEEAGLVLEIASGDGRERLEEKVLEQREFTERDISEIRDLMAVCLESGAADSYFDESKVEALYERLSALLYPESYAEN